MQKTLPVPIKQSTFTLSYNFYLAFLAWNWVYALIHQQASELLSPFQHLQDSNLGTLRNGEPKGCNHVTHKHYKDFTKLIKQWERLRYTIQNLTIPSLDRTSWTENLKSEPANSIKPVSDGWPPPCGWNTVESNIRAIRPSSPWFI